MANVGGCEVWWWRADEGRRERREKGKKKREGASRSTKEMEAVCEGMAGGKLGLRFVNNFICMY